MGIHTGPEHHTIEDGSFAAATSTLPVLQYYPARGRAEPIRLVLSYVQQPWFETPPAGILKIVTIMHSELDGYPFRQVPRFVDEVHGDVDLVQTQAILRHLARKYDLYGGGCLVAAGRVDMLLDAVAELRHKIRVVVVDEGLSPDARQRYTDTVLAPRDQLKTCAMQGPGLYCLEHVLAGRRYSEGEDGWMVGDRPTVVDFAAFDLVDLNLESFGEVVRERFPHLVAHHGRVAQLPGIAAYLSSASRHAITWPVHWLAQRQLQQKTAQEQTAQGRDPEQ